MQRLFVSILVLVPLMVNGLACRKAEPPAPKEPVVQQDATTAFVPVPIVPIGEKVIGNNRMKNGSFEEKTDDGQIPAWSATLPEGARAEINGECATQGDRSLRVTFPAAQPIEIRQDIEIPSSGTFLLRAFLRGRGVAGPVFLSAADAVRGKEGFYAKAEMETSISESWTVQQISFELPAYTKKLAVMLTHPAVESAPGEEATLWVDQFEFYLTDRPKHKNLLINGGFEESANGLDYWQRYATYNVSRSLPRDAAEGLYCIGIEISDDANLGIVQEVAGIVPNGRYQLRGYIKTEDIAGEATLEVQHGVKGWQGFAKGTNAVTGTHDWQWVSCGFNAPADTDKLRVYLRRPNPSKEAAHKGKIWFDGCELLYLDDVPPK